MTNKSRQEEALKEIHASCLHVHQECLLLITRTIDSDAPQAQSQAEVMSLLLASAQICQSVATLIQTSSKHLMQVLSACADTCFACAEACIEDGLKACSEACLKCAELCSAHLSRSIV